MPREKINHASEFTPASDDSSPAPVHGEAWPEPEANVSWTRGGDYGIGFVQVSLDCPRGYIENLMQDLARNGDTPGVSVFSPALKRGEINKLIQTLRRARDQAYGRDE